jgi:thioredoxin-dependent peroxiredoxin
VVILGVSPDNEASHQKFIADFGIPYPLLCDLDKTVMRTYGAFGEKKMDGKVVEGVIRSTVWIDSDGNIRKHWAMVDNAAEHPARVMDVLQASL